MTAFHFACKDGRSEIVEMILQRSTDLKIDLNAKDLDDYTAFHRACQKGKIKVVEIMIEYLESTDLDLNAQGGNGTGFHLACLGGYSNIVELLLQKSALINLQLNIKGSVHMPMKFHFVFLCSTMYKIHTYSRGILLVQKTLSEKTVDAAAPMLTLPLSSCSAVA